MKKITLLLLNVALLATNVLASIDIVTVVKFNQVQENTVTVASHFGQAHIDESSDLSMLKNAKIHHVDLVYTAYRNSKNFNQGKLNEERMRALIKLLPQLAEKDPSWRVICQTGATTVHEARQYFHGFILHFGPELSYENQTSFLEQFQEKPIVKKISNSEQTTVEYSSGTSISIPANAVVDMDGNPIQGSYNLEYREFRDQADIVYSGIPMTYSNAGKDYNFSSVGMYEVRANQNGNELKLAKSIQIDFNATEIKDDVGFFQMNDNTGGWEKLKDVDFKDVETDKIVNELEIKGVFIQWSYLQWEKKSDYTFSKGLFEILNSHLDTIPLWMDRLEEVDKEKLSLSIQSKYVDDFNEVITDSYTEALNNSEIVAVNEEGQDVDFFRLGEVRANIAPIENSMNATLLAEGSTDPGHTYPTLVKGLNSSKFGVYNCDQIYRIGIAKNIAPKYVDAKTGKEIKGKHVTCVMDLTYNGAFSFQPNNITCNIEGENVILLFTKDKKTYLLSADKFDQVKDNRNPVFAMTNMTKELKSSADLRGYLKR